MSERLEVSAGDALRSLFTGATIQQEARDRVKTEREIEEMTRGMPGWLVTIIWLTIPSTIFGAIGLFSVVPWIIERAVVMPFWLAVALLVWGAIMALVSLAVVGGSLVGRQIVSALAGLAMTAMFATYLVAAILALTSPA